MDKRDLQHTKKNNQIYFTISRNLILLHKIEVNLKQETAARFI